MAVLPIRIYPDPVLRQQCRPVEDFDPALRALAEDMVETMHAAPGVGLAAPQVGVAIRLAVVDVSVGKEPDSLHVLINPRIVDRAGEQVDVEACLSIPELSDKVKRPRRVRVEALDLDGKPYELEAEALFARVLCHELDHLDGILFFDHLRGLRKERARRHLKRLRRAWEERQPMPAGV
ncbi:MAG: peptide deformylase [Acidobacteria bacterium]|nr:MAG: peptide deformylase [Acidobacteriota bacterium]